MRLNSELKEAVYNVDEALDTAFGGGTNLDIFRYAFDSGEDIDETDVDQLLTQLRVTATKPPAPPLAIAAKTTVDTYTGKLEELSQLLARIDASHFSSDNEAKYQALQQIQKIIISRIINYRSSILVAEVAARSLPPVAPADLRLLNENDLTYLLGNLPNIYNMNDYTNAARDYINDVIQILMIRLPNTAPFDNQRNLIRALCLPMRGDTNEPISPIERGNIFTPFVEIPKKILTEKDPEVRKKYRYEIAYYLNIPHSQAEALLGELIIASFIGLTDRQIIEILFEPDLRVKGITAILAALSTGITNKVTQISQRNASKDTAAVNRGRGGDFLVWMLTDPNNVGTGRSDDFLRRLTADDVVLNKMEDIYLIEYIGTIAGMYILTLPPVLRDEFYDYRAERLITTLSNVAPPIPTPPLPALNTALVTATTMPNRTLKLSGIEIGEVNDEGEIPQLMEMYLTKNPVLQRQLGSVYTQIFAFINSFTRRSGMMDTIVDLIANERSSKGTAAINLTPTEIIERILNGNVKAGTIWSRYLVDIYAAFESMIDPSVVTNRSDIAEMLASKFITELIKYRSIEVAAASGSLNLPVEVVKLYSDATVENGMVNRYRMTAAQERQLTIEAKIVDIERGYVQRILDRANASPSNPMAPEEIELLRKDAERIVNGLPYLDERRKKALIKEIIALINRTQTTLDPALLTNLDEQRENIRAILGRDVQLEQMKFADDLKASVENIDEAGEQAKHVAESLRDRLENNTLDLEDALVDREFSNNYLSTVREVYTECLGEINDPDNAYSAFRGLEYRYFRPGKNRVRQFIVDIRENYMCGTPLATTVTPEKYRRLAAFLTLVDDPEFDNLTKAELVSLFVITDDDTLSYTPLNGLYLADKSRAATPPDQQDLAKKILENDMRRTLRLYDERRDAREYIEKVGNNVRKEENMTKRQKLYQAAMDELVVAGAGIGTAAVAAAGTVAAGAAAPIGGAVAVFVGGYYLYRIIKKGRIARINENKVKEVEIINGNLAQAGENSERMTETITQLENLSGDRLKQIKTDLETIRNKYRRYLTQPRWAGPIKVIEGLFNKSPEFQPMLTDDSAIVRLLNRLQELYNQSFTSGNAARVLAEAERVEYELKQMMKTYINILRKKILDEQKNKNRQREYMQELNLILQHYN
jgi:hypothetical protein